MIAGRSGDPDHVSALVRAHVGYRRRADQTALLLARAAEAARQRDATTARALLLEALELDPHSAAAWLQMAGVVDDRSLAIRCLETVLALEPGHPGALGRLAALQADG